VLSHYFSIIGHNLKKSRFAKLLLTERGLFYISQESLIRQHSVLPFVGRASLYNLFQIKPTRCTLLLSIFISTSLHVSGNYVPIIRRTYVSMRHWYFSLWMGGCLVYMRQWYFSLCMGGCQPSKQSKKYQCRIDTVSYPDDGHVVARNM